jgi:hypothetical protein
MEFDKSKSKIYSTEPQLSPSVCINPIQQKVIPSFDPFLSVRE